MRQKIDSADYLYLKHIGEPENNVLRFVVREAKPRGPAEDIEIAGATISGSRPIVTGETDPAYLLVFPSYVAYSVRNESYTSKNHDEKWTGELFRVYSDSHFLEYVSQATFATDEFPGPLTHYGITCLNHIVDVVATEEPKIERITEDI